MSLSWKVMYAKKLGQLNTFKEEGNMIRAGLERLL